MKAVAILGNKVTHTQGKLAIVADIITNLSRDVVSQAGINERDPRLPLWELTAQEALKIPHRLTIAADKLKALTNRLSQLQLEHDKREQKRLCKQREIQEQELEIERTRKRGEESLDRLRLLLASKEQEIITHKSLRESEVESLTKFSREVIDLRNEVTDMNSHREIFAFWQSVLTHRQMAPSRTTFRRYVTGHHLGGLDKLLRQILMVMYQDTHYAQSMTAGALNSLFEEAGDVGNSHDEDKGNISVLKPSMSIDPTLDYAKKSGGERKRVDLALFFALFIMSEARSAHRVRYMLVDEAFDGLDTSGQAAVLKLCHWMTERLEFVFVITHNQSLITLVENENEAVNGSSGVGIITAKVSGRGTEFEVNGVCISTKNLN